MPFTSTVIGAFDAMAGFSNLSNQLIVNELDQNHPMIIGAGTHAMVLTMVQYYPTPQGPNIVAAGVFDPWPGIGARPLSMSELFPVTVGGTLIYLASVRVTEGGDLANNRPSPFCSGGPGTCTVSGSTNYAALPCFVLAAVAVLHFRRKRRTDR
jgi:hypothetical protein